MTHFRINPAVSELEEGSPRRLSRLLEADPDVHSGAVFVIARKGRDLLETPVFSVGTAGEEEGVALFTDVGLAQQYLDEANWTEQDEVGQLSSEVLLRWLREANHAGIRFAVVNPNRSEHVAGAPQPLFHLDDLAGQSASVLLRTVQELAQG